MTTKKSTKNGKAPKRPADGKRQIVAYCRVSTGKQDLEAQRQGVITYATKHGLQPLAFFDEECSGKVPASERRFTSELLPTLRTGDVLIVSELSRLGRNLQDVLATLALLADRGIEVHDCKGGLRLDDSMHSKVYRTIMGLVAEIERDLIAARTREGMARARAAGIQLGRPKGSFGVSKLDQHEAEIKRLAKHGIPIQGIARLHNCCWGTCRRWMERRGIKVERPGARR